MFEYLNFTNKKSIRRPIVGSNNRKTSCTRFIYRLQSWNPQFHLISRGMQHIKILVLTIKMKNIFFLTLSSGTINMSSNSSNCNL